MQLPVSNNFHFNKKYSSFNFFNNGLWNSRIISVYNFKWKILVVYSKLWLSGIEIKGSLGSHSPWFAVGPPDTWVTCRISFVCPFYDNKLFFIILMPTFWLYELKGLWYTFVGELISSSAYDLLYLRLATERREKVPETVWSQWVLWNIPFILYTWIGLSVHPSVDAIYSGELAWKLLIGRDF